MNKTIKDRRNIISKIAPIFGVTTQSIIQRCRTQDVVDARFACYLIMREDFGMTLEEIARAVGGRDHGAVIHGVRKARFAYNNYQHFKQNVDKSRSVVLNPEVSCELAELDELRARIIAGELVDYTLTINK